jgi:hypothetical protein
MPPNRDHRGGVFLRPATLTISAELTGQLNGAGKAAGLTIT